MKSVLLGLLFILSGLTISVPSPTIILINGVPHLVELDDDLRIVNVIQAVPYYFTSKVSHSDIIANLDKSDNKKPETFYAHNEDRIVNNDEIDIVENVEFIRFNRSQALLNRNSVNRIRTISRDYEAGGIEAINLSITYSASAVSKILTSNRLNSVKDLLIAFGVDKEVLTIQKEERGIADDNPFVRIKYKKDKR